MEELVVAFVVVLVVEVDVENTVDVDVVVVDIFDVDAVVTDVLVLFDDDNESKSSLFLFAAVVFDLMELGFPFDMNLVGI